MQRNMRSILILSSLASCAATPMPFGLDAPGATPEIFAPGVVSTEKAVELNGVLSPDGRELFFTRLDADGTCVMLRTRLVGGEWSEPEEVHPYASGARGNAVDMTWSADGRTLAFLGWGQGGVGDDPSYDLWRVQREGDGWSKAELIPPPVSTVHDESYPCFVADGSLYFSSNRPGGLGEYDVWRAQRHPDGSYAEPVNLGASINSEYSDGDTWVSPDESVLVVASRRPGGHGQADLWISTRTEEGGWSELRNLGAPINTPGYEYCPMGSWDGRLFFFSRRVGATWEVTTGGTVHWVDPSALGISR